MLRYQGGKSKNAKHIVPYLRRAIETDAGEKLFVEPFFGSGSITYALKPQHVLANDANKWVIAMHKRLHQTNWRPPWQFLTRDSYIKVRDEWRETNDVKGMQDADTGFYGIAATFGGKFMDSPARDAKMNETAYAKRTARLLRQRHNELRETTSIEFCSGDYTNIGAMGAVLFCDPPYAGTAGYAGTNDFDHERFWRWAQWMSIYNDVYVTEYSIPQWVDHKIINKWQRSSTMGHKAAKVLNNTEYLYKVLPSHVNAEQVAQNAVTTYSTPESLFDWLYNEGLAEAMRLYKAPEEATELQKWAGSAILTFWLITQAVAEQNLVGDSVASITSNAANVVRFAMALTDKYQMRS